MSFFQKILDFFASLFGGGKKSAPKNETKPEETPTPEPQPVEQPETPPIDPPVQPETPEEPTENTTNMPTETQILLSKEKLKEIIYTATDANIDKYFEPLNAVLVKYEINTPLRIAHFIAQLAHESGSFRYNEEIWPNPQLDANGVATRGNSWQLKYEGRADLGNTQTGDGYRFRGRGLIQLTGRANYTKYGEYLEQNLTDGENPDKVAQPDLAADAAGWFWMRRKLNTYADQDDVLKITKRINGGTNGLSDRKKYLERAKQALGI